MSAETPDEDIVKAAGIVGAVEQPILLVLQPMTPGRGGHHAPRPDQLLRWQAMARERAPDVRVIPQCHKMMGHL